MFHMVDLVPVSGLDLEPAAAARFGQWASVLGVAAHHDLGGDDDAWTADELRALEGSTTTRRLQVLAVDEGSHVGAAGLILPLRDNEHAASVFVAVHPAHRRRGVGGALLRVGRGPRPCRRSHGRLRGDPVGRRAGRRRCTGSGPPPAGTWPRRPSSGPTSTSSRPQGPTPTVPDGYRLETHVDDMPGADLADRALLARRMSTDAPLGELELGEEEWDEERVRGEDERTRAMGRRVVATYVRHLSSGRLVGFTSVEVPRDAPALGYQQDTLVLREHRGHGLGLALKLANHRALAEALPGVLRVRTWNAVENVHMLAVNTALGFRPSGYTREWQKHLH